MPFISWENNFSVGIGRFDEDHQQLVGYINKLHVGMIGGDSASSMGQVLDGLVSYTVEHFNREENLMKKHSYPEYDAHKTEHENLVKKVAEFQSQFKSGKTSFSLSLMSFLRDWLINHIKGSDMKYRSFFLDKGER